MWLERTVKRRVNVLQHAGGFLRDASFFFCKMDRNIYQATVKLAPNISTQSTKHILCALLRDDNHQLPNISQLAEIYNTTERGLSRSLLCWDWWLDTWRAVKGWPGTGLAGWKTSSLSAKPREYILHIYMYDMYIYIFTVYTCACMTEHNCTYKNWRNQESNRSSWEVEFPLAILPGSFFSNCAAG